MDPHHHLDGGGGDPTTQVTGSRAGEDLRDRFGHLPVIQQWPRPPPHSGHPGCPCLSPLPQCHLRSALFMLRTSSWEQPRLEHHILPSTPTTLTPGPLTPGPIIQLSPLCMKPLVRSLFQLHLSYLLCGEFNFSSEWMIVLRSTHRGWYLFLI